jgi:uncharacterized protein (TIGR02271 family)
MENTVVAVYDTYAHAQNAMNELLSAGFTRDEVRLSAEGDTGARDTATQTQSDTGSGIGHFFRSLFGMEEHREQRDVYSEAVRRGHCVLTLDIAADDEHDRAIDILNRHDPVDVDERAAHWRSQGWTGYDESLPRYTDSEIAKDRSLYTTGRDMSLTENAGMSIDTDTAGTQRQRDAMISGRPALDTNAGARMEGQQRIPVVEEELRVGKREVQRGGVRVFQRLSENPVHEAVNLRQERVKVERHPVDQPASEADLAAFKEGSVEVRETAEEPVISKTARVVEEVVVGKEVTQQAQDIDDTVRRTDVEVEQLGAAGTDRTRSDFADTTATSDDADFRRHWQAAYGSSGDRYEDYDAAYRYGSNLAGTDRMKNYRWSDVEPDVRSDWESVHPESTWEKVKDAVRYGAERVTGKRH